MMGLGLFAKGVGRLDSDYLVALFGKPGSVAPGAGSNVKDQKLGGWEKRKPVVMNLDRPDAFVSRQEVVCTLIIDRHFYAPGIRLYRKWHENVPLNVVRRCVDRPGRNGVTEAHLSS